VHPQTRAERSVDHAVAGEADPFVELARVRVASHLDPVRAPQLRDRHQVLYQRTADAPAHPVRIDKKVLDLGDVPAAEPGRKADDSPAHVRDSRAALGHSLVRELEDVGVSEQVHPVVLVGQRRPAEHIPQRGHVTGPAIANREGFHATSLPCQLSGRMVFVW